MRTRNLLASAILLLTSAFASAQVDPKLQTVTDLADVYRSESGSTTLVAVFDMTPPARGVFESTDYLTNKWRTAHIGGKIAPPDRPAALAFDSNTWISVFGQKGPKAAGKWQATITRDNPDFGYVFAVRRGALVAGTKYAADVRMYRWPGSTSANVLQAGGTDVIGRPLEPGPGDGSTMVQVFWDDAAGSNDYERAAAVIQKTTHARFLINIADPSGPALLRQIDLPCPSRIFDSPSVVATPPQAVPGEVPPPVPFNARNYQRNLTTQAVLPGYRIDPWSEEGTLGNNNYTRIVNNITTYNAVTGNGTDFVMGNFFYATDYLTWIFYGKSIRDEAAMRDAVANNDFVNWKVPAAAAPYGNRGDFVVADSRPSPTGDGKQGWTNALPCMTRYQAEKSATINAFLNTYPGVEMVYRFVDAAYTNADDAEELEKYSSRSSEPGDRAGAATNPKYLRDLRKLILEDLKTEQSALQTIGPKDPIDYLAYLNTLPIKTNYILDGNNADFQTYDPLSPFPAAIALANTYRQIVTNTDLFPTATDACGDSFFVALFAASALNDSRSDAMDIKAAYGEGFAKGYLAYTHGNAGLSKGTPLSAAEAAALVPHADPNVDSANDGAFHPGVLGYMAAHGVGANNANYYKAPWSNPSKPTVSSKIQTMVISLAIPGTYVIANDNNGRNPHEEYFLTALWSDPTVSSYANANPPPSGRSVIYPGGTVQYYPSADPAALQQNLDILLGYVVFAKAALSAPATPATGVQNASQAYFGTFKTANSDASNAPKVPVWSGNLYAVGLDRTGGNFRFYGAGTPPVFITNTASLNQNFDNVNLWSAYQIFNNYQNPAPAPDASKMLGPSPAPLGWKDRTVYVVKSSDNSLEKYVDTADAAGTNSQITDILNAINANGTLIPAVDADRYNKVRRMMRFLLGAYDEMTPADGRNRDSQDKNGSGGLLFHVNIFGDVINSAPLSVELSKNLAAKVAKMSGDADFSDFYSNSGSYTDPHARLIIVGTNTGHLHCFAELAAKDKASGYFKAKATELWSFIPPNLFPLLWDIYVSKSDPTKAHRYALDGDPILSHEDLPATASDIIGDTRVSNGEDAVVVFGFRKGARDYYALQISDKAKNITPEKPKLVWSLNSKTGNIDIPGGSAITDYQAMIKVAGMSTSVPHTATVLGSDGKPTRALFLTGGYSNAEVDAKFKAYDSATFANGLGKWVLALKPTTGEVLKAWDFSAVAGAGAIPGGVATVGTVFLNTGWTHRAYFGDVRGGVYALGAASGDDAKIGNWDSAARRLFLNAGERFTNAPDVFRLPNGYPGKPTVLTVMVAIGSGDRNNPADRDESLTFDQRTYNPSLPSLNINVVSHPPDRNRFYVLADREDKRGTTIVRTDTQLIDASWPDCYDAPVLTPSDASYFWNTHPGWRIPLPNTGTYNAQESAYLGRTRDKVFVSPLIKGGAVFYSFFNLFGSGGFDCAPFATTRTFRQCDIMRPLYFDPQLDITNLSTRVGDVNALTKGGDRCTAADPDPDKAIKACSGLAFTFNSLSSQLVDSGDYVLQGGAKADATAQAGTVGANTADVQAVKDTEGKPGFRLRSWRVVR